MYIVSNGLLKAFYVSEEGKETIKSFLQPGDFIGSMTAVVNKGVCSFILKCLKDSQVLRIPFDDILQATQDSHEIAINIIELLLGLSMKKEGREYELLSLSAEKRYLALCERAPQIIEHVTQNDIARYLGITPVALSRIKKRVGN
jgi:CRP-like cAMP-binding protein